MYSPEKLSKYIGTKISSTLNLDIDNQNVIIYGAFAFFQTLWSILLMVVFGIVFNVLVESLIISFSSSILRKYSGGAHASSPNRCALIGVIVFGSFSILVTKITLSVILITPFIFLSFLLSYFIIYKYAPMDHPNKPIKKDETKKRLKKQSLNILNIYLLIVLILFTVYIKHYNSNFSVYILCICLGTLWQSITLIKIGNLIISKLDYILKIIKI